MSIKLDLTKFRHIKSDKTSTTLRHKDGHELTVSHKALSPENKVQLEALSKIAKDHQTPLQADQMKHKMAKGGDVKEPEHQRQGREAAEKVSEQIRNSPKHDPNKFAEYDKMPGRHQLPSEYHGRKTIKFSEGGEADKPKPMPTPKMDPKKAEDAQRGAQSTPDISPSTVYKNIKEGLGFAKGGKAEMSTPNDALASGKGGTSAQGQAVRNKEPKHHVREEAEGRHKFEQIANKPKLKGMAKGGAVNDPYHNGYFDKEINLAEHISHQDPSYQHEQSEKNYAMDAGLPCLNPHCRSHGSPHPNCKCYSGGEAYAEGGEVTAHPVCKLGKKHYPDCELYAEGGQATSERGDKDSERGVRHLMFKDDVPESEEDKNKSIEKEIEDAENFIAPQVKVPTAPMKEDATPEQLSQHQLAPANLQAAPATEAPSQAPQEVSPPAQQSQPNTLPTSPTTPPGTGQTSSNPVERFANARGAVHNDIMKEGSEWQQDLTNGHITPLTYQQLWSKNPDGSEKGSLGKISSLFGLLLSGAGSGLAHQPNAVLAMMDKTISNDLDAQKQSKSNAINHYRLAQQHEMNKANIGQINAETDAKALANAKIRMNYEALDKLVQDTNKITDPVAKQKAMNVLAMLNQAVQNDNYSIASRAATASAYYQMLGLDSGQGAAPGAEAGDEASFQKQQFGRSLLGQQGQQVSQYIGGRHLPGIAGQATNPLSDSDVKKVQNHVLLDNKVKDVIDFAKAHVGTLNPQTIAKAKQKAEELTAFYNGAVDGLGMTQGRLGWLEEQIKKNPTSIIQQILGNNARLKEIQDSNNTRKDLFLSGPGGLGFPKQATKSQFKEGDTGTHNGKPVVFKNGKWIAK